jgi:hypothetical protein
MTRRLRKTRTLSVILLLVSGGAIITVAVAWGFALAMPLEFVGSNKAFRIVTSKPRWESTVQCNAGGTLVASRATFLRPEYGRVLAELPAWSQANNPPTLPDVAAKRTTFEYAYGWPCVALVYQKTDGRRWALNIESSLLKVDRKWLPLAPLWPGFAINTLFYTAVLGLLFIAPGWVKRRIRARRCQCPACAYPIGSSDVCTECGRPVKSRSAPTQKAEVT